MSSLVSISRKLSKNVELLKFPKKIPYIYNPIAYAKAPHELYLKTWGKGLKDVLFLGMNPGPFGMAQTGVPFGEVCAVKDFLKIVAPVKHPKNEHPLRPIKGFQSKRSEISGQRFWGWVQNEFKSPESFFKNHFVWNYCPLAFIDNSGRNLTPDKFSKILTSPLFEVCDLALREIVQTLQVKTIFGLGRFAYDRAKIVAPNLNIQYLLHPSPASPKSLYYWKYKVTSDYKKATH